MIDMVNLVCTECGEAFALTLREVLDEISHMRMRKVLAVARQMHQKRGPFYDRWVKAMEARGAQKRCKTCLAYFSYTAGGGYHFCGYKGENVNPGQFACNLYCQGSCG